MITEARRRLLHGAVGNTSHAPTAYPIRIGSTNAPSTVFMPEGKAGRKARTKDRKARAALERKAKRIFIKKAAARRAEAAELGFRINDRGGLEGSNALVLKPSRTDLFRIDHNSTAALIKAEVEKKRAAEERSKTSHPERPAEVSPHIPWNEIDCAGSTDVFSGDEASLANASFSTLSAAEAVRWTGNAAEAEPAAEEKAGEEAADTGLPSADTNLIADDEPQPMCSGGALWAELEALETDAAYWKAECEAARAAKHDAEMALQRSRTTLASATADACDSALSSASKRLARALIDPNAQVMPSEALRIAASLYPERICVLESAEASASEADRHFRNGRRLLRLLLKLATDYFDVLVEKGDAEARKVFSNSEYAATESDTVKNGPLGLKREFTYAGKRLRIEQHLKIGTAADKARTLRCYFAWVPETKKLVIGHCGEHLPVSSFSR